MKIAGRLAMLFTLLAGAPSVLAQQPASIGTASGVGDVAVTEARRADAIGWNPALVGFFDGPMSSYSMLGIDVAAFPSSSWRRPARALGLTGVPSALRWAEGIGGGTGAAISAGRIQWFATQNRDFALSVVSNHTAAGALPSELATQLGGEAGILSPAPADSTMRSTSTAISAAKAVHVGQLPALGSVWVGATAKGWLVHSYARGAFDAQAPGEDVYREVEARNVPGAGLDVGLLAQPMERLRVGVSVSNVVAGAFRPKDWARVRTVSVLPGTDQTVEVTESKGPWLRREDEGTDDAQRAADLWSALNFPAVLRAGVSLDTNMGVLGGAVRTTLAAGGLDSEWDASRYSVAYAGPGTLPVKAWYSWGGESTSASVGVRLGSCERRWALGLVRRVGEWGTTYGLSASLTVGSPAGCDLFRS